MPRIIEYNPSSPKLNPNDRALQAWETAGRRVGPLYNQAAQDIRQAGAVKGEMEKAKIWPFDIYALEASNAPQIHNTTSTETRATKSNEGFVSGFSISESRGDGTGLLVGNGTSQGADYTGQYANAGYSTTPESAANASNAWMYNHGEASAGAVGMSRMARAAARGDLSVSDQVKRMGAAPSGDVPLNWRDMPDYNGNRLITDQAGGQYTPYQMDQIKERQAARQDRDTARQQAIDDRYQRQLDRWNKQQYQQWDGPNGWNTRRDNWINGKGGLNDQWQKDYDASIKSQAEETATKFMSDHAGEGYDKKAVIQNTIEGMRTQNTYSGTAPRSVTGPPPAQAPSGIIESLKGALGGMFGTEGTAFGSTLEDNNEEDY